MKRTLAATIIAVLVLTACVTPPKMTEDNDAAPLVEDNDAGMRVTK